MNRTTLTGVLAGAILLAGGLTAVRLADGSVESRHIKDGTVRGVDVNEQTLGTVPYAETAGTADHALSAGQAGTAERLLGLSRVSVSAAGELFVNSTGAVAATTTGTPGRYVVTLDSPKLGCFLLPSVAHNGTEPVAGSASAWRTPPIAETFGTKVTVETHAADGDGVPDPLPFNLLVVC